MSREEKKARLLRLYEDDLTAADRMLEDSQAAIDEVWDEDRDCSSLSGDDDCESADGEKTLQRNGELCPHAVAGGGGEAAPLSTLEASLKEAAAKEAAAKEAQTRALIARVPSPLRKRTNLPLPRPQTVLLPKLDLSFTPAAGLAPKLAETAAAAEQGGQGAAGVAETLRTTSRYIEDRFSASASAAATAATLFMKSGKKALNHNFKRFKGLLKAKKKSRAPAQASDAAPADAVVPELPTGNSDESIASVASAAVVGAARLGAGDSDVAGLLSGVALGGVAGVPFALFSLGLSLPLRAYRRRAGVGSGSLADLLSGATFDWSSGPFDGMRSQRRNRRLALISSV